MQLTVAKWGNSLGIRIPAAIAEALSVKSGDKVSYELSGNTMVIKKEPSTAELFEAFYGKPLSMLTEKDLGPGGELDWGNNVGGEIM